MAQVDSPGVQPLDRSTEILLFEVKAGRGDRLPVIRSLAQGMTDTGAGAARYRRIHPLAPGRGQEAAFAEPNKLSPSS